jgi:hypothetical protein
MDAGSTVKVRFYRQAIEGTTPVGNSVLISEQSVAPLPGFNSANTPDQPNWTTATATLDTSGLGESYQIFWVVVWAEDASGLLVTELPGHGLSAFPGTLLGIGDAPLEQVMLNGESKTFSNNVGYLHRKFYVAAQSVQAPGPLPSATARPVLEIRNASVTPASGAVGGVIVSFDVTSEEAAAEHVHVQVYADGKAWRRHRHERRHREANDWPWPFRGWRDDRQVPWKLVRDLRRGWDDHNRRSAVTPPRPFDVETLPYVAEGASDRVEVPYRATLCGPTEFVIVVRTDVDDEGAVESVFAPPTRSWTKGPHRRPGVCRR